MDEPFLSRPRTGVTVITAVRNGLPALARTLASVREQTWPDVEHIVMDGASTDGTIEVLRAAGGRVSFASEPDRGLYDAMNKGIERVEDPDRYVLFLNADDTFAASDALGRVLSASRGEDLIYARLERLDESLGDRDVIGREVRGRAMLYGMRCHHQATLCRRSVFDRVGRFDLAYRIAADYDWMVRVFKDNGVSKRFVPATISTMGRGGVSDRRYLDSVRERWRIVRRHYPASDVLRYALYTGFGDYGRYWLQQALGRVGLLKTARRMKRGLAHEARTEAGPAGGRSAGA